MNKFILGQKPFSLALYDHHHAAVTLSQVVILSMNSENTHSTNAQLIFKT